MVCERYRSPAAKKTKNAIKSPEIAFCTICAIYQSINRLKDTIQLYPPADFRLRGSQQVSHTDIKPAEKLKGYLSEYLHMVKIHRNEHMKCSEITTESFLRKDMA